MRLVFLGTGTSVGIPMIGCRCPVCTSGDPRNRRRRTSLLVQAGGTQAIVDTSPDFREQCLAAQVDRLDAVFLTHAHADHIFGFDDIRALNPRDGSLLPVYGAAATLVHMRRIFPYVEDPANRGFRPRVRFETLEAPVRVGDLLAEGVPVLHGDTPTLGYRFEAQGRSVGYVPDCAGLDAAAMARFTGLDVMILDGLRQRPHSSHFTIAQSVETLLALGARRSFLVHMNHEVDHAVTEAALPDGIRLACDGLVLDLDAP